ncbi:group xv phospholipase a2 [Anaeramoeba flamelloides]|uniref:Group xv phospholipase a2 n=1 Tax=Anaeramoeba flamelloides TaxID=1746091 RepID=A0AAV7Y851_9EUKA|nr:group xv phospholipase a2 [Anaeramoeba flamelloides]
MLVPKTLLLFFFLLIVFVSGSSTSPLNDKTEEETSKNPIVIIPGCMGSKLEAKLTDHKKKHWWCSSNKDWFLLWINVELFVPELIECAGDYMQLEWDGKAIQYQKGIDYRLVPGLEGIQYLQPTLWFVQKYFHKMIEEFKNEGYQEGRDLFGLPYDFRMGPNNLTTWFKEVKSYIETAYNINNKKVNVITHSMGGKLFNYFMAQKEITKEWKATYVSKWIPIAPAWGGAFETIEELIWGMNFGDILVKKTEYRPFERSFPMSYYLLPIENVDWSEPIIVTPQKNYMATLPDYLEMMNALDLPQSSKDLATTQWEQMNVIDPPMVPTYILYGTGVDTNCQVEYSDYLGSDNYKIKTCSGDGTVSDVTVVALCEDWKDDHFVSCEEFKDREHVSIVEDDDIINRVNSLVKQD